MMREQGNGKRTEKKLDDVNWIESTKRHVLVFHDQSLFQDSSSPSVKFLIFRNLKHVENVGLLKYHTNRLTEDCRWICYLRLPLIVHSNRSFLSKK